MLSVIFFIVMLNVSMLSVVLLNVVVPRKALEQSYKKLPL
jgi:hypothetical protein